MVEAARTSNYSAHDGSGLWVGVGNVSDTPLKPTLIDPALNPTTPVRFSRLQGYAPRGCVRQSLTVVVCLPFHPWLSRTLFLAVLGKYEVSAAKLVQK